jgi:hypothetical protein
MGGMTGMMGAAGMTGPSTPPTVLPTPGGCALAGTYAAWFQLNFDVPGQPTATTDLYFQAILTPLGSSALRMVLTSCDQATAASAPVTFMLNLHPGAGCGTFDQPSPVAVVRGAKLADPLHDMLPALGGPLCGGQLVSCASAQPPPAGGCICDEDGDNQNGVSISMQQGGLNLTVLSAIRDVITLNGTIMSAQRLSANVTVAEDLSLLGCLTNGSPCSNFALNILQGILPKPVESTQKPSIVRFAQAPSGADCGTLVAMRTALFGQ